MIPELPKNEYLTKMWVGDPKHQREVFDGRFQKVSTRGMGMQIPFGLVSEVSIQDFERGYRQISSRDQRQLCEWKKVEILAGKVQIDHIHLVLSIPPKYSVSELVGFLKGKSAIKIFDMHLGLKRRYWGRHFWAKGYCVSTVGLDEEQIRKYVRWQLKRDRIIDQLKLWKR